jgi:hypothetical protein
VRHKWIASSILILSPGLALAPAVFAQRSAGGNAPSGGAPVALPRTAVAPQAIAAPHAQAQAIGPAPINGASGAVNVPARASIHAMREPGSNGSVANARAGGVGIGAHRITSAPVSSHRVSVMSGLGHLPLTSTDFVGSPGLGFDYSHVAAVSGANSLTNGRLRERIDAGVPLGFGGFLLSPEVIVVEGQQGEPLLPSVDESAEANTESAEKQDRESHERIEDQFAPVSLGKPAPVRDAAEYVFVRRDGSLVFAVGYSWEHGTLHYVTREGYRRSLTRDALDLDATQQFNEQRGLNFRTPA